jgi:hypothetical protein
MSHLSPKQTRAIEALLVEHDQTAAAAACGINRRTLSRWLANREFRQAHQRASAALLWNTVGLLRAASADALATLRTALQSDNDNVRVRAAVALLELAVKADTDILAMRVEALEENATSAACSCTVSHDYWSSSTFATYPNDAWDVSFNYGFVNYSTKSVYHYVRAVRGGL